jgi:predicted transposase/invertase (TIGR01784 family)
MEEVKYIPAKMDFMFKAIFGSEARTELLRSFLAAVFSIEKDDLPEIQINKNELEVESEDEKRSILDLCVRMNNGVLIDVEIQLRDAGNIVDRSLLYWSKMYARGHKRTVDYAELKKCVTINILDYPAFPCDNKVHRVHIVCDSETKEQASDKVELHFIELKKLPYAGDGISEALADWLLFLSAERQEDIEKLKNKSPELMAAVSTLVYISREEEYQKMFAREKYENDRISRDNLMRREGRDEEKRDLAKAFFREGVPRETIKRALGITDDEKLAEFLGESKN